MRNLDHLFQPKSVAIVGASTNPAKIGAVILQNLIDAGYQGDIYPVNPKADALSGLPCYASITDIPDKIDQVTICIPASGVLPVVEECAAKKVKSIIIISAGFGEKGSDNKELQDKISTICKENNILLIGPNVIGVLHPATALNNSWMPHSAPTGNIAFLSQSGALCCSILDLAPQYGLGFSHFCSLGNKAGLDELDLVRYFMANDEVKVIACYLEDIKRGYDFIKFLREHVDKPIIIFHSGKSTQAAAAAASHTGAMTSNRDLVRTALEAGNVLEAETLRDFCLLLQAFSKLPDTPVWPKYGQYGIITNAGGAGIIAVDEIIASDKTLSELSPATKDALQKALPEAASISNPVDILGDAKADRYAQVLDIIGQDEEVEIILNILTPQHVTEPLATAQAIVDYSTRHPGRLLLNVFLGGDTVTPARQLLAEHGLLVYSELHDAIRVGNLLTQRAQNLYDHHDDIIAHNYRQITNRPVGKYHALIDAIVANHPQLQILSDHLTAALMQEVGINLPVQKVTTSLDEAVDFATGHYPVVLKAPNQALAHKTDSGAIFANIHDDEELASAFATLQSQLWTRGKHNSKNPPALLIQQMITDSGLEFFIGAKRDGRTDVYRGDQPGFGHLLTFGQGGIYTEIHHDLTHILVPERRRDIKEKLWETRLYPIIEGYRGQTPLPEDQIVSAIKGVQQLVISYPEITAIDLNPLLVTDDTIYAVDVKIFIEK